MKISYLFILSASLFVFSCSKIDRPINNEKDSNTTSFLKSNSDSKDNYQVSLDDIRAYCKYMILSSKADNCKELEIKEILPKYTEGVLAYYIINTNKGWKIISADKRGPIVLGECDFGSYNKELEDKIGFWFDVLANDIKYRKNHSIEYYSSSNADFIKMESECIREWNLITSDTQAIGPIFGDSGHYELFSTYFSTQHGERSHLLSTHWDQNSPFNNKCPYMENSQFRCPAGCVPIAVSQVIYYLHYIWQMSNGSPTNGICYGDEHNYYQSFSNYSNTTWDYMDEYNDPYGYAANFIGDIGLLSGVEYGSSGTGVTLGNINPNAYNIYNISFSYSHGFDSNIVYNNLRDSIPVVYGANRYESLFSWPGHAFVVDGYGYDQRITHYVYQWVYDDPTQIQSGFHPSYETTQVSSTTQTYYLVNWGYGNNYGEDDAHYALSGNWSPFGSSPYQYQKEMFYDFRVIN